MVKIRLRKTGSNNNSSFRVVATDRRSPRDGKFLEILGWYSPRQEGENFKLDLPRIDYWVGKGAQMSETVASMVRKAKKAASAPKAEPKAEAPKAEAKKAEKKAEPKKAAEPKAEKKAEPKAEAKTAEAPAAEPAKA
jgi:small subunit ribosomal protein S16